MAKISEVLHLAADEFLCATGNSEWLIYSCCAVEEACEQLGCSFAQIRDGLKAMGCNTGGVSAFNEFELGPERQAARYSWLKFAALIAEEQGQ